MPRPRKHRFVRKMPINCCFIPNGVAASEDNTVVMMVEEYETIRLIDFEGLTQEQCAIEMQIARTTVQGIYDSARKKLAKALVEAKVLIIEGGSYKLFSEQQHSPVTSRGHRHGGRT